MLPAIVFGPAQGDLWATLEPTGAGLVVVVALGGLGALSLWLLLRGDVASRREQDPYHDAALAAEVEAIGQARERLVAGTGQGAGPERAALSALLEGPLSRLDRHVAALLAAGPRAVAAAADGPALRAEATRLHAELEQEDDAAARALLAASLADVDRSLAAGEALQRGARLAQLELRRVRTLLETLPARISELSARQGHRPGDLAPVEELARALDEAFDGAAALVQEVLATPPPEAP